MVYDENLSKYSKRSFLATDGIKTASKITF